MMNNIINIFIKTNSKAILWEIYSISLSNPMAHDITMRNIINSLIKTHRKAWRWEILSISFSKPISRHYDEKYNQYPYQNPSQGITMRKIINFLIKTHRKALSYMPGGSWNIRIALTSTKHRYYPPLKQSWFSTGGKSHPRWLHWPLWHTDRKSVV